MQTVKYVEFAAIQCSGVRSNAVALCRCTPSLILRYEPSYGARPLKRAIQREVETVLAKRIIAGDITAGDYVVADVINERLVISTKGTAAESCQPPAATGVDR